MNKCIFFALITSKRPDHGRSDLLRLILSFTSLLKFKIARDISYIHTVESTQILFVAKEMLFYGEMAILRTLCRTCGARARVRINVQMDCHRMVVGSKSQSSCSRVGDTAHARTERARRPPALMRYVRPRSVLGRAARALRWGEMERGLIGRERCDRASTA